ncbi:nuclear transport factor 2 family protein [Mycolicibacterium smegmatis]|jgi:hypothetical protein|uniref:SnoaL-like domain-containing protein n=2 Tax=Mycolicibacterium smegmatis TaxID=1772 RepID=A0QTU3_MYCS2|nr:hypothetical protein [Mycolicibacterium smegmatis]ABK73615.1 hypothetical protein MSMEG_1966 [Mycolicibacterium smegmatis MC2 155]MBE9619741.1 hypothetical protein [Mycolicibacterium smegmatis]MBE9626152.1 hypothetical protein [Mycolicibacterium smegmatis]MBE9632640.1 hypothetical protein [Mycolicibacterium smegmatis]MBE9644783.1 hypothetical protein [Mycolicibacterium smegmatis]
MSDDALRTYREAIGRGDVASLSAVFAENAQLRVPLFNEPLTGRQTIAEILGLLFGVADSVHLGDAFTGSDKGYAIALTLKVGGVELEGMEYVHFDDDNLVDVLLVALRPLDGLIAMHNTIAPLLGQPAVELVAQAS